MSTAFNAPSCRVPKSSCSAHRSLSYCGQQGPSRAAVGVKQQLPRTDAFVCRAAFNPQPSSRRDDPTAPSRNARPADMSGLGSGPSTSGRQAQANISDIRYREGEFVELGEVIAAHGVKGEVKVNITTDSPKQRFGKTGTKLYLKPPAAKGLLAQAQAQECSLIELTTNGFKVQMAGDGKEIWILKFKEIEDRTVAEKLRYHVIVLPCAHREDLRDPDEFYAQDLIGSHVFDQEDGLYVGQVMELFSGFGTVETLQLKLRLNRADMETGRVRTCMVPFIKAMVPLVDTKAKRILVSLPEGLLDLCASKKIRPLDFEKRALKLQEFRSLEEQEQARRLLEPVVLPPTASVGEDRELLEEMSKEDMQDEEDEDEDAEVEKKPVPARRFRSRRPPPRRTSRSAAASTPEAQVPNS